MISICVPTKDRAAFLARLLRYFAQTRFPGRILIGDSSGPEHARRIQATVEALRSRLDLEYREYPGLSSCECIEQLNRLITTPYCAFVGDDDFLCTPGVARCVQTMERYPELNAVHGRGLLLYLDRPGPTGPIAGAMAYPQTVLQQPTGAGRLREFLTVSAYALFYSIHRRETWRALFEGVSRMEGVTNTNFFKDELMAACVSAIRGPIAEIEGLTLVRQSHDGIRKHPNAYDWITHRAWWPSYQQFYERLVEELMRQDALSREAAGAVVKDVFWEFLGERLVSQCRAARATSRCVTRPSTARRLLKAVPGVRAAWTAWRAAIARRNEMWSLPALLDPASPHHEEFLPIYRAVTTPAPVEAAVEEPVAAGGAAT